MLQLTDKRNKLLFYILLLILLSTININVNKVQRPSIAAVKKINVAGLSNYNNLEIEKTLNSILSKNIFFVKKKI